MLPAAVATGFGHHIAYHFRQDLRSHTATLAPSTATIGRKEADAPEKMRSRSPRQRKRSLRCHQI
jgi:hypothetical protein